MNHYLKILMLGLLALLIGACGKDTKHGQTGTKTYTVSAKPLHKTLHFTGSVQPLHESSLVSPMDAVVETMKVHYGQRVKKGEVILILNSSELQKQYNDTLTDYLKAKDSYSIAQAKFSGTKELWNSGLISKNNYLSEQSGVDTARVTLMQSSRKLTELLEKMDDNTTQDLSSLSLADFDKVQNVLTSNHHLIQIKAPIDGVMLYPPKSSEEKTARLGVGSAVKSGQVLALIGDLKGISVEIEVPEVDIVKIHPGMQAVISGVAFEHHQLQGHLVAVNAQALNSNTGSLPSFNAVVEVPSLTQEQQSLIKIGMSAAIELKIDSEHQLVIPIEAVKREKGASVVFLQLAQGSVEKRVITTGSAQADSVIVETGLKVGDKILYD